MIESEGKKVQIGKYELSMLFQHEREFSSCLFHECMKGNNADIDVVVGEIVFANFSQRM